MAAREKEALIENAIRESNTISEECKQELLKYYQKKKLYMKNGVFSLEGDKKTYEDMIFELQDENQTLKDNWDKLKEDLITSVKYWEEQEKEWINLGFIKLGEEANSKIIFKKVLDKMQELEEGEK